jgi:peptide deformylase
MPYKLVKYPDPQLNGVSLEIESDVFYRTPTYLDGIKKDMIQACEENDGMGLSAIQVGHPIRMMVMKQKLGPPTWLEMCNPKVLNIYGKPVKGIEGCLSFPGVFGIVSRNEEVELQWTEISGKICHALFGGIEARCILHEIDHMDGITFNKRMTDVERFKIQQKLTDMRARFKNGNS